MDEDIGRNTSKEGVKHHILTSPEACQFVVLQLNSFMILEPMLPDHSNNIQTPNKTCAKREEVFREIIRDACPELLRPQILGTQLLKNHSDFRI